MRFAPAPILFLAHIGLIFSIAPPGRAQCPPPTQRLTSPAALTDDRFGISVGIDGERIVVGAIGDNTGGAMAGAAHVFQLVGGQWIHETTLVPVSATGDDFFGRSVAISGRVIVVGGDGDDPFGGMSGAGTAAVFRYRDDNVWTQDTSLNASDFAAGDGFGWSVAIDGDVIVVGCPGKHENGTLSGAAYVYRYGADTLFWSEEAKLTPGDPEPFKFFGESVAVQGNVIVIGASGDTEAAEGAGAGYVFVNDGSNWHFAQKLMPTPAAGGEALGKRVALDSNLALLTADGVANDDGSLGSVYAFRDSAGAWQLQTRITPQGTRPEEQFGVSVAYRGGLGVIGATYQDPEPPDPNNPVEERYAYVVREGNVTFHQLGTIRPDTVIAGEIFNFNLALFETTAVVGAFERSGSGSTYIFDLVDCESCVGDLNGDGQVDIADLANLLSNFGTSGGATPDQGDLDGDGDVDLSDLAAMLSRFGSDCG